MKKLLVMYIVLLLTGAAKGDYPCPSYSERGVSINPQLEWQEGGGGEYRLYFWWLDEDYADVTKATVFEYNTEEAGWFYERT